MKYLGTNLRQLFRTYGERTVSPTISASALTLDLALGGVFLVAKNGTMTTLTIANVPASTKGTVSFSLKTTANGSSYTWTWPASVKWASGTAPTFTTTNNKRDWFTFVSDDGGTTWFGFVAGQNF